MFRHHHHGHGFRHGPFSRHPFGAHEHRGFGRGRGERRERVFEQGDLRLIVLALIAEKPRHGYELIKEIEERVGGAYSPSPGVVYPTLTLLEDLGFAEVTPGEGAKKPYGATEAGRRHLEERAAEVEALFARIAEAGARGGRAHPQILRALENLRSALRYRLEAGPVTEAEVDAIVDALDAAARAVERR